MPVKTFLKPKNKKKQQKLLKEEEERKIYINAVSTQIPNYNKIKQRLHNFVNIVINIVSSIHLSFLIQAEYTKKKKNQRQI